MRKWSYFDNIKYSTREYLCFTWEIVIGSNLKLACQEAGVSYNQTACDYVNFARDIFKQYVYLMLKNTQLSVMVEIDESLFGK